MNKYRSMMGTVLLLLALLAGCGREPAVQDSNRGEEYTSPSLSATDTLPASDTATGIGNETEWADPSRTETEEKASSSAFVGKGRRIHFYSLMDSLGWGDGRLAETVIPGDSMEITEPASQDAVPETETGESAVTEGIESGEATDPAGSWPETTSARGEQTQPVSPATEASTYVAPASVPELNGTRLEGVDYDAYLPVPAWVGRSKASGDLAMQYGGYYTKNSDQKVIYITFCMDYENGYTGQMLDMLAAQSIPAAFFITGTYLSNRPDIASTILNRGHVLGSHSYRHVYTSELSDVELINDFVLSKRLFANVLGYSLQYYRPAYGFAMERDMYLARKFGFTTVMFSFYYQDYDLGNQPGKWEALEKLKSGLQPGAVYYLHVTPCNIQALPEFAAYARSLGYSFLRIDQSGGGSYTPPATTAQPTTTTPPATTAQPTTTTPPATTVQPTTTASPTEPPAETPAATEQPSEVVTEPAETSESAESQTQDATTEEPGTEAGSTEETNTQDGGE